MFLLHFGSLAVVGESQKLSIHLAYRRFRIVSVIDTINSAETKLKKKSSRNKVGNSNLSCHYLPTAVGWCYFFSTRTSEFITFGRTQPVITCSKLTTETIDGVVLVSLLLI